MGSALWHSKLGGSLRHENHIRVLVQIQKAPFPIQLPINVPWKTAENGRSMWILPLMWEFQREFRAPGFSPIIQNGGGERWNVEDLSVSPLLFVTLSNKHINIFFLKKKKRHSETWAWVQMQYIRKEYRTSEGKSPIEHDLFHLFICLFTKDRALIL